MYDTSASHTPKNLYTTSYTKTVGVLDSTQKYDPVLKVLQNTAMSTLNVFRINFAILQPNLCDSLPNYGTPNLYEKSFFLFLFDG